MRVGFTGTQEGMSEHQQVQLVVKLQELGATEFHHGDCVGADAQAHDIVREFFPDAKIVIHPPINTYKRAFKKGDEVRQTANYLDRNKNIVNETKFLIGAPKTDTEELRSGTWSTIRYARKIGRDYGVLER